MNTRQAIDNLNTALDRYFNDDITIKELIDNVSKIESEKIRERLMREGYFLIGIVLDTISELPYYLSKKENDINKPMEFLKDYYKEYKDGVDPRYTKLRFKIEYSSPNFNVEARLNSNKE